MSAQDILPSLDGKWLEVWKVPSGEVAVSYQHCEVKDGFFLKGIYGLGKTFNDACDDYLSQLHGKTLVFNACTDRREEIRVL